MSKRSVGVGHKIPPDYELTGHWQINLKGWGLVVLAAGAVIVFGLTIILGFVARGILQGSTDFHVSVGLAFPIFLAIIATIVILHEGIHGLVFLIFGGKPRFGVKHIGRFFPVALYASAAGRNDLGCLLPDSFIFQSAAHWHGADRGCAGHRYPEDAPVSKEQGGL